MEGNLSRARSSLGYSEGSTPSPQLGRPATATRDGHAAASQSHSRIKSEDGIRDITKSGFVPPRSASAMGAAGGYRQPSRYKRDEAGASNGISHHPLDTTLEESFSEEEEDDDDTESPLDSARLSTFLSPTFGTFSDRGLTRSASAAQMRDIQDQVQGLKGKISSLKEQAKADSLKRRSLQSLRTPSPFTHARWDQGLMEPREIRTLQQPQTDGLVSPGEDEDQQQESMDAHAAGAGGKRDSPVPEENIPAQNEIHESATPPFDSGGELTPTKDKFAVEDRGREGSDEVSGDDDVRTENGDFDDDYEEVYDDAQDEMADWESESGESTYHDSYQHQVSHEDREDAFDYEHFFLHSALGSISRRERRGSSGSDDSEDSIETTRGPASSRARKRYSIETSNSDDTFATANEGRASRGSGFRDSVVYNDGAYDELPPLQEVRSNESNEGQTETRDTRQRQNSVLWRPTSAAQAERLHRPSVSSLGSTGTNRSFPLVNKAKMNGGVLTPGGSPDPTLKSMSETLLRGTTNGLDSGSSSPGQSAVAMQGLAKEDQIAVQRLVASLGKCVLGLGEASKASSEARLLRRRLDAARRILEGQDEA